jgi:hypothetical protein
MSIGPSLYLEIPGAPSGSVLHLPPGSAEPETPDGQQLRLVRVLLISAGQPAFVEKRNMNGLYGNIKQISPKYKNCA